MDALLYNGQNDNGTSWDLLADFQALLRQPLHILEDITDKDLEDLKGNYEYRPPKYDAFVPKELKKRRWSWILLIWRGWRNGWRLGNAGHGLPAGK